MLKRRYKKTVISGVVVVLLVFFHTLGWISPVESAFIKAAKPSMSFFYDSGLKLRQFYEGQTDRRDLNEIVKDLSQKTETLTLENSRLRMVEEENKALRQYLKFTTGKTSHYVMANVIAGGEINLVNQAVTIDKGTKQGLANGLAILNSQGQVVGKIISANQETSSICLINQNECQFAASVLNENKTIGIVKGDLGLVSKMDFIPQTENVKAGEIVVTSGLEKNIARGMVLGQITSVNKENNALWQTAKVESLANLHDIAIVSVALP
jgi:rod shape-determining protein MreC